MQIGVFHRELCLLLPNAVVLEFGIKIGVETEFVVKKILGSKARAHLAKLLSRKGAHPNRDGHR